MRSLLVLALLTACSAGDSPPAGPVEPPPPVAPAEPAAPVPSSPPRVDPATPATPGDAPLALDAVLPTGAGWKCVSGRCDRQCVYPRPSHAPGPDGRVVQLSPNPPCTDATTAFCAAFAASPGNRPSARCWATRESCEADRASATFATTACEER